MLKPPDSNKKRVENRSLAALLRRMRCVSRRREIERERGESGDLLQKTKLYRKSTEKGEKGEGP